MKIEVPASKSKEVVFKVEEEPSPSPFMPTHEICRTPGRTPTKGLLAPTVTQQLSVADKRKNPMIFCSGFFIGLFIGVMAILIPNIVFSNGNVFGICLKNEAPTTVSPWIVTTKSNPDFDNRLPMPSHQHDYLNQVICHYF